MANKGCRDIGYEFFIYSVHKIGSEFPVTCVSHAACDRTFHSYLVLKQIDEFLFRSILVWRN